MREHIDTVIIGGGQAGLAVSYCLSQHDRPHIILEQAARAGSAWREGRWDSFTAVTPNWGLRLPGAEYQGDDPDGFLPRDGIVAYLEQYITRFHLPIRYGVRVTSVEQTGAGYRIETDEITYTAANVIIATGLFQQPRIPSCGTGLPPELTQLHSSQYRNPAMLPPGGVLVVGSGQSGAQIAEELHRSGRAVYLSTGGAGRVPRRYRGKDVFWWLGELFSRITVEQLPSPQAKFAPNAHLSGTDGGHTINLRQLAREGVVLLGHLRGVQNGAITLAPDLTENLAKADKAEADFVKAVDAYVARSGLDAPEERLPDPRDGDAAEEIQALDLAAAGVTSVVWATGYTFDFGLVKLPVCDEDGYPIQRRGVTAYAGLYFVGLPWLHTAASGLLVGVGEDAAVVAAAIAARAT